MFQSRYLKIKIIIIYLLCSGRLGIVVVIQETEEPHLSYLSAAIYIYYNIEGVLFALKIIIPTW